MCNSYRCSICATTQTFLRFFLLCRITYHVCASTQEKLTCVHTLNRAHRSDNIFAMFEMNPSGFSPIIIHTFVHRCRWCLAPLSNLFTNTRNHSIRSRIHARIKYLFFLSMMNCVPHISGINLIRCRSFVFFYFCARTSEFLDSMWTAICGHLSHADTFSHRQHLMQIFYTMVRNREQFSSWLKSIFNKNLLIIKKEHCLCIQNANSVNILII